MQLHLIHWDPSQGEEQAERLRKVGFRVQVERARGTAVIRGLREKLPDAVLIDLSRMPSYGRDVAAGIRLNKATRHLPILFAGGEPGKVEKVQRFLPDATYTSWERVTDLLKEAVEHPPSDPVVPESILAGYSGTPLPKKLGIRAHSKLALIKAPRCFLQEIGPLPANVSVVEDCGTLVDLTIFFARNRRELVENLERLIVSMRGKGGLWIAWPKKSGTLTSDLTQSQVRSLGLSNGLVDYKVCSIDSNWSGLKFAKRASRHSR